MKDMEEVLSDKVTFGAKNKRKLKTKIKKEDIKIINESYALVKQMIKLKYHELILYVIDNVLFGLNIILFLIIILKNDFKLVTPISKYKVVGYISASISIYFLVKFSLTNFMFKSKYYKDLIVYNISYYIDNKHFTKKSIIDWQSLGHVFFNLFSNILTALFINYIINANNRDIIGEEKLVWAIMFTVLNLAFLPSVINSINDIKGRIKNFNYLNSLILKTQYLNNKDLFKNIVREENQRSIYFENIDLKSKDGVFIINNKKLLSKEVYDIISQVNDEIFKRYEYLWEKLYVLLDVKQATKHLKMSINIKKKLKRSVYCLSEIFFNFFE